jgi:hypothetical protein
MKVSKSATNTSNVMVNRSNEETQEISMEAMECESSDDEDPDIQSLRNRYATMIKEQCSERTDPCILVSDSNARAPPRKKAEIEIKFTPRQFPTAARETQDGIFQTLIMYLHTCAATQFPA